MGAAHSLLVHSGGQTGPCIHFHMEMRGQADREGGRGVSSLADMTAGKQDGGGEAAAWNMWWEI